MNDQNQIGYFHSVQLIEEKCKGCVNCIKHCPTEAIRVRDGRAKIQEIKCVDCGECVRICPNQAKTAIADTLDSLSHFKYNIALPAPAIYGQFPGGIQPERILAGLIHIGFDDVFEVAYAAEIVSAGIRRLLADPKRKRPLFSSSCPVIVRLIQVRFPDLLDHIAPVVSPMRLASRIARKQKAAELGINPKEIGLFFISPCPGKVSAIRDPYEDDYGCVDGAIPIKDIYGKLHSFVYGASDDEVGKLLKKASGTGIGLARAGGEILSIGAKRHISVDGIHNVIQILEEIEHGKLLDMDYIEMLACLGGCVGGVLTVENSFITRRRIRDIATTVVQDSEEDIVARQEALYELVTPDMLEFTHRFEPRPTLSLDDDMATAIRKMERLEEILERLPGLDCGSCGAPDCRALAEDIVRDLAVETDCIFVLRDKLQSVAQELMMLAAQVPPAMGTAKKELTHDEDVRNRTNS